MGHAGRSVQGRGHASREADTLRGCERRLLRGARRRSTGGCHARLCWHPRDAAGKRGHHRHLQKQRKQACRWQFTCMSHHDAIHTEQQSARML